MGFRSQGLAEQEQRRILQRRNGELLGRLEVLKERERAARETLSTARGLPEDVVGRRLVAILNAASGESDDLRQLKREHARLERLERAGTRVVSRLERQAAEALRLPAEEREHFLVLRQMAGGVQLFGLLLAFIGALMSLMCLTVALKEGRWDVLWGLLSLAPGVALIGGPELWARRRLARAERARSSDDEPPVVTHPRRSTPGKERVQQTVPELLGAFGLLASCYWVMLWPPDNPSFLWVAYVGSVALWAIPKLVRRLRLLRGSGPAKKAERAPRVRVAADAPADPREESETVERRLVGQKSKSAPTP